MILKNKLKVYTYSVDKFAHLGFPEQYEDFIKWSNYFKNEKLNTKKEINYFSNFQSVMLGAGKGLRLKKLFNNKFLVKLGNVFLYKKIFDYLSTYNNSLISDKKNELVIKDKNIKKIRINSTNSMFETIKKSRFYLIKQKNFFLTSCDCIGFFDKQYFRNLISKNTPNIIFFGFNPSYLHNKLQNAHSYLATKNMT